MRHGHRAAADFNAAAVLRPIPVETAILDVDPAAPDLDRAANPALIACEAGAADVRRPPARDNNCAATLRAFIGIEDAVADAYAAAEREERPDSAAVASTAAIAVFNIVDVIVREGGIVNDQFCVGLDADRAANPFCPALGQRQVIDRKFAPDDDKNPKAVVTADRMPVAFYRDCAVDRR